MDKEQARAVWKAILRRFGCRWDWHTFHASHPYPCAVLRAAIERAE